MHDIERTRYPISNPQANDSFTRSQIIAYLDTVPLGYRTEQEHECTCRLIDRIQMHFIELDNNWKTSID